MGSGGKDFKRNTDGMRASAARKAEMTRQRVLEAIDRLLREGQAVNMHSVTKEAGVARSYLYRQGDLRARIEALRDPNRSPPLRLVTGPVKEAGRTDRSKDMLLAAKDIRIKELEADVRRLKDENKRLHGKLYEMRDAMGKDSG